MADYLYSTAIQANSFQNNKADKAVWQLSEYSLHIYVPFVLQNNHNHECYNTL